MHGTGHNSFTDGRKVPVPYLSHVFSMLRALEQWMTGELSGLESFAARELKPRRGLP